MNAEPQPQPIAMLHSHTGRILSALARDFQRRTLSKCHQRGHRRIRSAHTALISHLGNDGICLSELALRSGITQQATGKLVKELERCGYLRRDIDSHDRRARIVRLTELGVTLLNDLCEVLEEVRNEYRHALGDETLQSFELQLRGTMEALQELPDVHDSPLTGELEPLDHH